MILRILFWSSFRIAGDTPGTLSFGTDEAYSNAFESVSRSFNLSQVRWSEFPGRAHPTVVRTSKKPKGNAPHLWGAPQSLQFILFKRIQTVRGNGPEPTLNLVKDH